jgi:molybdopterin-guanine dinucleotide biosynthesis protein A
MRTPTAGIVLCGGRSSRMGRPKCWLPVGGEPMLLRVVRVVAAVAEPVVVVAAAGQEIPLLPDGVEVVRDDAEGNGPLQGLAAGLTALAGRADAAVVTGCDSPLLTAAVLGRLIELRGSAGACVPVVDDVPRPLPGVYAVGVAAEVRALLAAGQLRLGGLLDRVPTRLVRPAEFADVDPALDALRNVNTPDDYARLVAGFGAQPDGEPR